MLVWITAFSTRSTNATLPVSLATSKNKVGVSSEVMDLRSAYGIYGVDGNLSNHRLYFYNK